MTWKEVMIQREESKRKKKERERIKSKSLILIKELPAFKMAFSEPHFLVFMPSSSPLTLDDCCSCDQQNTVEVTGVRFLKLGYKTLWPLPDCPRLPALGGSQSPCHEDAQATCGETPMERTWEALPAMNTSLSTFWVSCLGTKPSVLVRLQLTIASDDISMRDPKTDCLDKLIPNS